MKTFLHNPNQPPFLTCDASIRSSLLYIQHIHQLLPTEVPRERFQRLLAVHEDDGIALLEEVLRGGRPSRASAEVVNESHCVVF